MRIETAHLDNLIDDLCAEIASTATSAPWPEERFFTLAHRILAVQQLRQPRNHSAKRCSSTELSELPCVSTDLFRYRRSSHTPLSIVPQVEFKTSGTTTRYRGVHSLYRTDIYDLSAAKAYELLVASSHSPTHLVSLVLPWHLAPDSSLSYMIDSFARTRFRGCFTALLDERGLDRSLARGVLLEHANSEHSVLLFTTTAAAQKLLQVLDVEIALAPGSLLMTTGGTKAKRLSGFELEQQLLARLGNPTRSSEYGMTELLSQAYQFNSEPFILPPWCRVVAMDPLSNGPSPHGSPGLLRFVDLANLQSAIAIQTADIGLTHSASSFSLLGRLQGAVIRGCSLSFSELEESLSG